MQSDLAQVSGVQTGILEVEDGFFLHDQAQFVDQLGDYSGAIANALGSRGQATSPARR